jgi:membrane protease YdiL (CAAX protease family)
MKKDSGTKRHPLMMYIVLAFAFTWLILSPGVAATLGLLDFRFDGTVLTILSGLGPLAAALIVTAVIEGRSGVQKLFRSMFNWKVEIKWWIAAVLLLAGLFVLSSVLNMLTGGYAPDPKSGIYLNGGNTFAVLFLLLIGSFGEEPGWRGFALPKLQQRTSPLIATLIVTLIWWLWHLPTYWTLPMAISAVQQYGFAVTFGIQLIVLLALSILCAWVYNGSRGSTLLPVLLHAGWNFWAGAFGQGATTFLLPLFLVTALVVALATKGKLGISSERPAKN